MAIEEQVAELEHKMKAIREDYQAGRITRKQAEELAKPFVIEYRGCRWIIGLHTGTWYRVRVGSMWKKSKSPLLVSSEELANEPTGIVLDDSLDIKEYLNEFHQNDEK